MRIIHKRGLSGKIYRLRFSDSGYLQTIRVRMTDTNVYPYEGYLVNKLIWSRRGHSLHSKFLIDAIEDMGYQREQHLLFAMQRHAIISRVIEPDPMVRLRDVIDVR